MITNNPYNPLCYMVTKINEMTPQGIIKLNFKQDDYDEQRDNTELLICDYYSDTGHVMVDDTVESSNMDIAKISRIISMVPTSDTEIESDHYTDPNIIENINLGVISYYGVEFSDIDIAPKWSLTLIDNGINLNGKKKEYYEGLIKITQFNNNTITIKPGKANSLIGRQFMLSVQCKESGEYYSYCILEVV